VEDLLAGRKPDRPYVQDDPHKKVVRVREEIDKPELPGI
jgi:hypothetical protein